MAITATTRALAALLAATLAPAALADCKADGPLATARWIFEHAYRFYAQGAPDAREYLTPALLALLEKEWRCKADQGRCALDADPWIDSSEGEAGDPVVFSLVASPIERRRVAVRFVFQGEPARAELSLVQDASTQCWLADDLAGRRNTSLRRRLQQHEY